MSTKMFGDILLVTLIVLLASSATRAQAVATSPTDLVRSLSEVTLREMMGLDACGSFARNRALAASLTKAGAAAIPELEKALSSVEEAGQDSAWAFNAMWLILPYAKIEGAEAYPRLRRMADNPKLAFLQPRLDHAAALSLNLTSYVSESRELTRTFHCNRAEEPRDALDQLILAWEKGNRAWLEGALGPNARVALNHLLDDRTWGQMRADLWPDEHSGTRAVGYRFQFQGRWAEPDETLDEERAAAVAEVPEGLDLQTQFTTSVGNRCFMRRVTFVKTSNPTGSGYLTYLVDNSDLGDLLRSIASCAAEPRR